MLQGLLSIEWYELVIALSEHKRIAKKAVVAYMKPLKRLR
jgi:hypothetical protein